MKRIFIAVLSIAATLAATEITIWSRSQCPYCISAENALIEAMSRLSEEQQPEIKHNYIMDYAPEDRSLKAMHGQSEVDENMRRMVITAYFPENYEEYARSRNTHFRDSLWRMDAQLAGIDTAALRVKVMEQGEVMAMEHALRTQDKRIDASPTIFVDGRKLTGWGYDMPSIYIALQNLAKSGGIPGLPTCDEEVSGSNGEISIKALKKGCRP